MPCIRPCFFSSSFHFFPKLFFSFLLVFLLLLASLASVLRLAGSYCTLSSVFWWKMKNYARTMIIDWEYSSTPVECFPRLLLDFSLWIGVPVAHSMENQQWNKTLAQCLRLKYPLITIALKRDSAVSFVDIRYSITALAHPSRSIFWRLRHHW